MITKFLLLSIIAFALAQETKILKIEEGNADFEEKLVFDEEEDTEEIHTPAHNNLVAVTRKIFYRLGLEARLVGKKPEDKSLEARSVDIETDDGLTCIISKIKDKNRSVKEDKEAFEKTNGKFPYQHIEESLDSMLLESFEDVPEKIREFCGDAKIVRPIYGDLKELEKKATKLGKAAVKDSRKRAVVREFVACTNDSTLMIMKCPVDTLYAKCKIRRRYCTYSIKCPLEASEGGFNCNGVHVGERMVCCDYGCPEQEKN